MVEELQSCSLFDSQSVLQLPNVVDLQLHWAPVSIGSITLRICSHLASHQWMADLLPHTNLLVELDIAVDQLDRYFNYSESHMFAERLGWLLSLCHHLQSFKFIGYSSAGNVDAEQMVVDRHNGACLHRLSLSTMFGCWIYRMQSV